MKSIFTVQKATTLAELKQAIDDVEKIHGPDCTIGCNVDMYAEDENYVGNISSDVVLDEVLA